MELNPLRVFLTVANEKSFSRAAEKLLRTQPAISLAIQRLEAELGEKLIDRSAKDLLLTDAGAIVLDYARRFASLESDLENALAELRDKSAGRLAIGANESSTLYLLDHIERFRRRFPRVKVQIRRSLSSRIPAELIDGELELRILTYDPGDETFIAHNVVSPYRALVIREFQRHKVPLRMDLEMPTVEAIRKMVQRNDGVAFLPRMVVEEEVRQGILCEVAVTEMNVDRPIRLAYPARRALSHAAQAFLDMVVAAGENPKAADA